MPCVRLRVCVYIMNNNKKSDLMSKSINNELRDLQRIDSNTTTRVYIDDDDNKCDEFAQQRRKRIKRCIFLYATILLLSLSVNSLFVLDYLSTTTRQSCSVSYATPPPPPPLLPSTLGIDDDDDAAKLYATTTPLPPPLLLLSTLGIVDDGTKMKTTI